MAVLTLISSVGYGEVYGHAVGFVRFTETLEVLSCAVLNGGSSTASALFIMQVPHDYRTDDPMEDAVRVRDALGLPEDSVGMMTAAEVDHVFNVQESTFEGFHAVAVATAGLSNHVVAGDVLDDYPEKSIVSARRGNALQAGTINICVLASEPLTEEGRVNLFIPLVEAKSAAMADSGYRETGTTSDAMAVFSPIRDEGRITYTGTGSYIGIATARAVREAVGYALRARGEHPLMMSPTDILDRMGVGPEDLYDRSGTDLDRETFYSNVRGILDRDEVVAALDLVWTMCRRTDSLDTDGDPRQATLLVSVLSDLLDVTGTYEGPLMDRVIDMISRKAGGF